MSDRPPGPMLDAQVARRLWRAVVLFDGPEPFFVEAGTRKRVPLPAYSTDTDEAHRVISQMHATGHTARISADPDGRFRCVFSLPDDRVYRWTIGLTAAHAICLAALAALDGSNVEPR